VFAEPRTRGGQYEVSFHAQQERLEEDLDLIQIEAAIIEHGELLEEYPDDPRGDRKLLGVGFCRESTASCSPGMGDNEG
jgi:hypothetical protein